MRQRRRNLALQLCAGLAEAHRNHIVHGDLKSNNVILAKGTEGETRAVITVGTPHRGSVRALDALANGKKLGPIDLTKLVRSLPSVYELLPLFPVLREVDGTACRSSMNIPSSSIP